MKGKLLKIGLYALLVVAAIFGFSLVEKQRQSAVIKEVEVNIIVDAENQFVSEDEILHLLSENNIRTIGMKKAELNLLAIENLLMKNSAVEIAEVYATHDGILKIKINQRRPLLRVFDMAGRSCYIDNNGKMMPLISAFTSRVPVANGYISNISYIGLETEQASIFTELFEVAKAIENDSLMAALVEQIYVNSNQEIELISKAGPEVINIGNSKNMADKFDRLKLFYEQGLPNSGWNKYNSINLKINNQVICTKN